MRTNFLKSEAGFSIVQGIILAGVMAGTALVATRLISDQKMAQNTADSKDSLEQLHTLIYSVLQNRDHCYATIMANSVTVSPSTTASLTSIYSKTSSGSQKVFEVNPNTVYDATKTYINNKVSIKRMDLIFGATLTAQATLRIYYSRLQTNENQRLGKGYGGKELARDINIVIQRNSAPPNTFLSCYSVNGNKDLAKSFCETMGTGTTTNESMFTWNATYNICELRDNRCPTGNVFAGIDTTGRARCYPLENSLSPYIDSTTNPCAAASRTSVRFVIVGGKVQIKCN